VSRVDPEHPGFNLRVIKNSHKEPSRFGLVTWTRLAPMVAVCAIPFGALLFISANSSSHSISPNIIPVLSGAWALFALWITLDKGRIGTLGKDPTGTAWLLLGLFNLIAALGAFLIGGGSTNP
jgi:hypothetical protein